MDVGQVSSTTLQQVPPPEASEVHRAGRQDRKRDGDADNGVKAAPPPPQPTTNLQGQTIGATINTSA